MGLLRRPWRRLVLWFLTFAGGVSTGFGLLIHGQVELLHYLRHEVGSVNILERWLGNASFAWRNPSQKLLLAIYDIPDDYLQHSERVAWGLMLIGGAGVALVVPFLLRWRWKGR